MKAYPIAIVYRDYKKVSYPQDVNEVGDRGAQYKVNHFLLPRNSCDLEKQQKDHGVEEEALNTGARPSDLKAGFSIGVPSDEGRHVFN